MVIKLNFFIAGAPRSGTTSLFYYLNEHPDVYLPELKEPHYFCDDLRKHSKEQHGQNIFGVSTREDFENLFKDVTNETLIGEASTSYYYSQTAAERIYDYNKNAKILMLVREPISFLYSWFSYLKLYDEENFDNFEKAVVEENIRIRNQNYSKNLRCLDRIKYSNLVNYKENIDRFYRLFGKDNFRLILYDDYKQNTQNEYIKIVRFLGLKQSQNLNFQYYNVARTPRFPFLNRLYFHRTLRKINIRRYIPGSVKTFLKNMNERTERRPELDKSSQNRLKQIFSNNVDDLEEYLNTTNLLGKKIDLRGLWDW